MKRYPKYRDSGVEWIGKVPAHWDTLRIKRAAHLRNERRNDSPEGWTYIGLEDVESESGRYAPTAGASRQSEDSMVGLFRAGDVLYGKLRPYLRKAIVAEQDGVCSTEFLVLSEGRARATWLHRWLLTSEVTQQIEAGCDGAKMPRADWEHVGSIPMPLPPPAEQIAIAAALDRETARIDELMAKKTRFIELLKEKRQALITHAVTKGLDPNVKMKDSGVEWIGEVPDKWRPATLKRAVVLQRGHDLPENQRRLGHIPVVSSAGISGTHDTAVAKAPGIVTGRYGSLGKFTFIEQDYWPLNTALYSIEFFANWPRYVWYLLQSFADQFVLESMKSAVPGIDRNDVHEIRICLPPRLEQESIATRLDREFRRIDSLVAKVERSITLLKERRSALITAAVTGQIDLRDAASPGKDTSA